MAMLDRVIGNGVISKIVRGAGVNVTRVQWYNPNTGDIFFKFTFDTAVTTPPVTGQYTYQDTSGVAVTDQPGRSASLGNTVSLDFGNGGSVNDYAFITAEDWGDIVFSGGVMPGAPVTFRKGDGIMDATPDATIAF